MYLLIILCFKAKLNYKSIWDIFCLLNNHKLILKNLVIIDKKFSNNILLCQLLEMISKFFLIFSTLKLMFKHNNSFYKIYHL